MSRDNLHKKFNQVRESYIVSLNDKKKSLQQHWQELQTDWHTQTYDELYIIIHSLAGSAGTFDLPDITDSARAIIDLFKENKTARNNPDKTLLNKIEEKLDYLIKVMDQAK